VSHAFFKGQELTLSVSDGSLCDWVSQARNELGELTKKTPASQNLCDLLLFISLVAEGFQSFGQT